MVFMDDNFLLTNETARVLYHQYASEMPIIDYHCHIPAEEIAKDVHFSSITDLWLGADHYKWRAMRLNGVKEELITGDGDPYEKFEAFAGTLERAIGNPLYHWSHLELQRYFGIDTPSRNQLISSTMDVDELCKEIGADTLAFISIEGMFNALKDILPESYGYCKGCFTGEYPVSVPGELNGKRL